jgi:hypothetical protein
VLEGRALGGGRKGVEARERPVALEPGETERVFEGPDAFESRRHFREPTPVGATQSLGKPFTLVAVDTGKCVDERKRGLALAKIGAGGFADPPRFGAIVEDVVDELESPSEMKSVTLERLFEVLAPCGERTQAGTRGEEDGGLTLNGFEVRPLVDPGVAAVEQLKDLTHGNGVRRLRENLHDPRPAVGVHHLEGTRVEEVPDQDRGLVAPETMRRRAPASLVRLVDDVVVKERGGMDELDDRGEKLGIARRRARGGGARSKEEEKGPHALAARPKDVAGQTIDERDIDGEPMPDQLLHTLEALADRSGDLLELRNVRPGPGRHVRRADVAAHGHGSNSAGTTANADRKRCRCTRVRLLGTVATV